jgi:cardiolipin synthase A/B
VEDDSHDLGTHSCITNPYFLLDDRMTRALTEAARRGVRVVLLLPGAIDNRIVRHASRAIGSTNLDTRSFALNEEVNLVVYSHEWRYGWRRCSRTILVYARRIDPQTWRERGAVDRLLEVLSLPIRREL